MWTLYQPPLPPCGLTLTFLQPPSPLTGPHGLCMPPTLVCKCLPNYYLPIIGKEGILEKIWKINPLLLTSLLILQENILDFVICPGVLNFPL